MPSGIAALDKTLQAMFHFDVTNKWDSVIDSTKAMEVDALPTELAISEGTYIYSGPPVFKGSFQNEEKFIKSLHPIGLVQNISLNVGNQIVPYSEIGSKFFRHSVGRAQYSANLSRILPMHTNIIYALYAWFLDGQEKFIAAIEQLANKDIKQFYDFESEIFKIPFGLYTILTDASENVIQQHYWERCHIPTFNLNINANNPLIMESINIVFSRLTSVGNKISFFEGNATIGNAAISGLESMTNTGQQNTISGKIPPKILTKESPEVFQGSGSLGKENKENAPIEAKQVGYKDGNPPIPSPNLKQLETDGIIPGQTTTNIIPPTFNPRQLELREQTPIPPANPE